MDKVLEKAKELRLAIKQTPEYIEYMKNKELLENNKDVLELKQNIANLKAQDKYEEAKNLEEIYNKHPLVNNFEVSKDNLYELLKTIQNIIQ